LFLAISIGLGFGANQGNITVIAFILILSMIVISKRLSSSHKENSILNLIIMSQKPSTLDLDKILDTLNEYCSSIALKRLDETKEMFEVALFVEFVNYEKLIETKKALQKLDQELKITYLDNSNINIG